MLTAAQAGARIGISAQRVRVLIRNGRLRARKIGRDWLIDARDLKAVEIRRVGRPSSKKR